MTRRKRKPSRALAAQDLRWRFDPGELGFETTADLEPEQGVIGQETALEALQFGLETRATGQNIFVRGLQGTGRMTMVRRLLEQLDPRCPSGLDRCYVHNFGDPGRPRLVSLPQGQGRRFRRMLDDLADFIRDDLGKALSSEAMTRRRNALEERLQTEVRAIAEPFEKALQDAGLVLATRQVGTVVQTVLSPVVEGKPMTPEEFEQLHAAGQVSDADYERYVATRERFEKQLRDEVQQKINAVRQHHLEAMRALVAGEARAVLQAYVDRITQAFPQPAVQQFVKEIVEDVVENRLDGETEGDFTRLYRVNLVAERPAGVACAVVVENTPTLTNLLGGVDREVGLTGTVRSDHLMIRGGSLLRADGGYLIMEARDVLAEPGAWKVLIRTLRSRKLEIVPPEFGFPWVGPTLQPEPIDIDVKVILLGDSSVFYTLDALDPDFPHLFKLLADFDTEIPRDRQGAMHYAGVLARIAQEEGLVPFDRAAVAALVEHGARIAARAGKLTARFGRLADIAREASHLAAKAQRAVVGSEDVRRAVRQNKRRADLPSRRFRELLARGTIRVQTRGKAVGQINGLAVQSAGPMVSGFPARITATIGAGSAGVINIEREAALSGAIHTKGFYILGGLLRHLLHTDHPLAFSASVAFEQSYGGIDGDSASGAEICCLLSALTEIPLRQDLAMTGAIDQVGNVLAIGAVNEKIEGFFDTCRDLGLTGTQGVVIPSANAGDLMLREDVVEAAEAGTFHVYAVDTVQDALECFTGMPAGERDAEGVYPEDSVLGIAMQRAHDFWVKAVAHPGFEAEVEPGPDEDDTDA